MPITLINAPRLALEWSGMVYPSPAPYLLSVTDMPGI